VSLNRWACKWRLNVETLSHSLMSAGEEFQTDGNDDDDDDDVTEPDEHSLLQTRT